MKKICFLFVFACFFGFAIFSDTDTVQEVHFLLFMPNSGDQFADETLAMDQLDNAARYLLQRNLGPGQIQVDGYAAFAVNDIDSVALSRSRALHVIQELQRRGLGQELFAEPTAFGSVDLWGSNNDEDGRSPNRRVRILYDGREIVPADIAIAQEIVAELPEEPPPPMEEPTSEGGSLFPWIWLIPLLLALLALLLLALKKKKKAPAVKPQPIAAEPQPEAAVPITPAVPLVYTHVNLEEEIRFRAYELYLERQGHNENAYEDWCTAVIEVCARYTPKGYETYTEDGNWWARRESKKASP